MKIDEKIRKSPMLWAVLTVVIATVLGLIAALKVHDTELRKVLYVATATLFFGGFIGGLLKILLDDFTLIRRRREDNALFVANVLNDLKSVYDRVGRIRILIPAHKSAKTYGDEMRDLIEARVSLLNVMRALDGRTEGLSDKCREQISCLVKQMEQYLNKLTSEFRDKYKNLSNHQRIYEAQIEAKLNVAEHARADQVFQTEDVWIELQKLSQLGGLIDDSEESPFKQEFENPLDRACKVLRELLRQILAGENADCKEE